MRDKVPCFKSAESAESADDEWIEQEELLEILESLRPEELQELLEELEPGELETFVWELKDLEPIDQEELEGSFGDLDVLIKLLTNDDGLKERRKRGAPEDERDGEVWKDFRDTGWQVSDQGRTRNTWGEIRTPRPKEDGYCYVRIKKDILAHHVVAEAFGIPDYELGKDLNHKNGNPSDNRLCNLEWVWPAENVQHSYATNLARKSGKDKRSLPVECCAPGNDVWTRYPSASDAARTLKLNLSNISECCNGKPGFKTCGKLKWRHATIDDPDEPGEVWRDVGEEELDFLRPETDEESSDDSDD